jgi:hypothetical protein
MLDILQNHPYYNCLSDYGNKFILLTNELYFIEKSIFKKNIDINALTIHKYFSFLRNDYTMKMKSFCEDIFFDFQLNLKCNTVINNIIEEYIDIIQNNHNEKELNVRINLLTIFICSSIMFKYFFKSEFSDKNNLRYYMNLTVQVK